MRKTITLEVEVTLDESAEESVIQAAREHYSEVGGSRVPLDHKGERWREVPAEEFIPDTVSAIMELIAENDLLEELGVEFTTVSGHETPDEAFRAHGIGGTELQEAEAVGDQDQKPREVNLDEFETGVYLCRWPNGDVSLVAANTRREALVELDEWDAAHPSQLFPLESCMVDFKLNDQGEIELKQFGEDTEESIWEIAYPKLHAHLLSIMRVHGGEHSAKPKESIRQTVQHERERLWKNQPAHPQAETEFGKTLQKDLRTTGPVADYYVQEMAHRELSSMDEKSKKPN
jgi:hypothetical protein